MKCSLSVVVAMALVLVVIYVGLSNKRSTRGSGQLGRLIKRKKSIIKKKSFENRTIINLSTVVCGDRYAESLVMLKSASLMNRATVHAHIFAEDHLQTEFKEHLDAWPTQIKERFSYTLYPIQYPPVKDGVDWKVMFRTCSSQRLFFPDIFYDMDSVLYVDTDVLFLHSIDDIWSKLERFNSTQIVALTPEVEEGSDGWYSQISSFPYVPPHGVNSGVMLMNLTRMRMNNWLSRIITIYRQYRYTITLGDQDLINIYFHQFPEQLYQNPCNWNYRENHCIKEINCKAADENGISILHGNNQVFHNRHQPAFRAVYEAIRDYKLDELLDSLLEKVLLNLRSSLSSPCGRVFHLLTLELTAQVNQRDNTTNKTN